MDTIDQNERRRALYATDAVHRARRRAESADYYRRHKVHNEKSLARTYRISEALIVEAAFTGSVFFPGGTVLEGAKFLPATTLGRAMGVPTYTFGTWIRRGEWPAPMCAVVSASRAEVFCLEEALTYARVFADIVGDEPICRPFVNCPALGHTLERARQKLRANLMARGRTE